jgi:hypothetical protein
VNDDAPTEEQQAALADVRRRLEAWARSETKISRMFQHYEDDQPIYWYAWFKLDVRGIEAFCGTARGGAGLMGHYLWSYDARDAGGPRHLIFGPEDRRAIAAAGWQHGEGRWPDADAAARAFQALGAAAPRVLRPADLPSWAKWPWAELARLGLAADRIVRREPDHLVTEVDGIEHRLRVSTEDLRLVDWWHASPPALPPLAP